MSTYDDDIRRVKDLDLPWEILDKANILVVGATGLIGRALVDVLMQLPDKTFHLYAGVRDLNYAQYCFAKYDNKAAFTVLRYDVAMPVPFDVDFHYIIHAASYAGPGAFKHDPVGIIKANILGVDQLFSYGTQHNLKKLLYISSAEVYGEGNGIPFSERDSGILDWVSLRACYPSAKRAAETLCVSYASQYGIETSIVRPCHVYGPFFTPKDDRAYAQFIRNVLAKENIILKSMGLQQRSWCYVVDCAFALLYVLLKGENQNAYNIADMQSNVSIREFAGMIASKGGQDIVFNLPEQVMENPIISQAIFDTEKINKLGWYPLWKLKEGISNTLDTLNHIKKQADAEDL